MNSINCLDHIWVLMPASAILRRKKDNKVIGEVRVCPEKGFQVRGDFDFNISAGISLLRDYGKVVHRDSAYQLVGLLERLENSDYTLVSIASHYEGEMKLVTEITFCGYKQFCTKNPEFEVERLHDYGFGFTEQTPDATVHPDSGDSPGVALDALAKRRRASVTR
jgi:hypothetical protein